LSFSGGLGLTEPRQYSYSMINTYQVGSAYLFNWKQTWLCSILDFRYVPYVKSTEDFIYTLYWWKGLNKYKIEIAGDFSVWTENKNHGDSLSINESGKRFFFFGEPQFWFNLNKTLSMGSKINLYYNVLLYNNLFYCYPTLAIKYKF